MHVIGPDEAAGQQLLAGEQVDGRDLAGQRGQVGDAVRERRLGGHQFGAHQGGQLAARRPLGDQLVGDEDLDGSHAGQGTAVGAPHVAQEDCRAGDEEEDRRGGGEESTLHVCGAPIG